MKNLVDWRIVDDLELLVECCLTWDEMVEVVFDEKVVVMDRKVMWLALRNRMYSVGKVEMMVMVVEVHWTMVGRSRWMDLPLMGLLEKVVIGVCYGE